MSDREQARPMEDEGARVGENGNGPASTENRQGGAGAAGNSETGRGASSSHMGSPATFGGGNSNEINGGGNDASTANPQLSGGAPGRWSGEEAIDPALRIASDERKSAGYAWEQGRASSGQDAMGITSLMDAEKQSDGRVGNNGQQQQLGQTGGPSSAQRSTYGSALPNQMRRQEDPRRGSYQGQGQGQGGNGNAPVSLEDEYRRRESYAQAQHQQPQYYQQGSGPGSQGQSRPPSSFDSRPAEGPASNLPQVLRNAPPSLTINPARATPTESDVRAVQSPRDGYRNSEHPGSLNVPGFQEYMNRGVGRFATGAEQAAYRAGFEEAWEYRSKYLEDERARRVSLNMSTAPPTSSLRTTDNNPGPSPAKEDQVDLPGSRTIAEYVGGYDNGWEREVREYARNGEWSAGQDRSYQLPGTAGSTVNDTYQSPYMAMTTPQGAPYNSFRTDASPMASYSGHVDGRQDRTSDSMTPNSKPREKRIGDRQAISCQMCRQRKSKCDGNPPYPCGPCTKKGTEDQCQYATFVRRRGPAKKKEHGSNDGSNSPPADGAYVMDPSRRVKSGSARKYDDQGGREDPKRPKI